MTRQQRLKLLPLSLFGITVIGVVLTLVSISGVNVIPGKDFYNLRAAVPTAAQLDQFADVRQAGVRIGRVTKLERGPDTSSTLTLRLEPEYGPVYRDAKLLIRSKSVAEEKYVELDPGHPSAGELPEGELLSADRALEVVEHDDVFSILNRPRRRDLQRALGGLGPGLDGGGDLNRTLESSAALTDDASPLAETLAAQREHVSSFVDSFGRVARALGERRDSIQTLTVRAKVAAEAVAARDERLRATLEALPPFLAQVRGTAGNLAEFSPRATPVVRDLATAFEELVPAVTDLRPAASHGRRAVAQLDRFADAALPALRGLRTFSRAGEGFVPPLAGLVRELNPLVGYLDSYWRELGSWFALEGAGTKVQDGVGHVARPLLPISRTNFAGNLPPELEEALDELMGGLDTRGTNAYPRPGEAGNPTPFEGQYQRLERESPYRRGR